LIGTDPVIDTENFREIVLRMLRGTESPIVLTGLEHNGVPSVLNPPCLGAIAVPFGPIDGLMVVPEATDINVGIAQTVRGIRKKEGNGKG
jgi:hypothetical protein